MFEKPPPDVKLSVSGRVLAGLSRAHLRCVPGAAEFDARKRAARLRKDPAATRALAKLYWLLASVLEEHGGTLDIGFLGGNLSPHDAACRLVRKHAPDGKARSTGHTSPPPLITIGNTLGGARDTLLKVRGLFF